jgi:TolB-like protein/Tfp pilus assembly protein PilF
MAQLMKTPKSSVIQVGDWRVDAVLDEISKDGKIVKLEPKTMRLLFCLADHAGQVVSIQQLLNEVWKNVVVTPDSVYHAVAALRRVLGDDTKEPAYIANVLRRGYRLVAPVAPWVDASALSCWSIAVLPFADLSETKDQQYLADGMAEEIINSLSKLPEVQVPARTSSFYFRGKATKLPDVARELKVAHLLEGSLRKSGSHIRITAQLVRAKSGYNLWSETFDRELDDFIKVQQEIADAVVRALKLRFLEGTPPRSTATSSSEAYTLYLQARSIALRAGQADYETAIDYLQRALKLDPKFAAAWADLANDRIDKFLWHTSRPYQDIRPDARHAAENAVGFDPSLSDGHLAMAKILYWLDWNWDSAEVEFDRAIVLDAGNADALRHKSYLALTLGRPDQALQLAQAAVARDPLNSWNYYGTGLAHYNAGKLAHAEAAYRKALELNPTGAGVHTVLGFTLLAQGEPTEALATMQQDTDELFRETGRACALDALGRNSEAEREIAIVERKYAARAAVNIAVFFARRKDFARALAWLDSAYGQHDPGLVDPKWNPSMENLETDLHFKAFRRKMKLPEYRRGVAPLS